MKKVIISLLIAAAVTSWWLYEFNSLMLLWSLGVASVLFLMEDDKLMSMEGKAVVITGCDTGFGNHIAKYLDSRGVAVFAACLHSQGEGARELVQHCSNRLTVVQMDVTSDDQCAEAVAGVVAKTNQEIWGVVNNAGIDVCIDAELIPMKLYEKVISINLFGIIRVTKAFLPWIRRSKGRVVNVTSVKGVLPEPFGGAYSTSKFGAEAFSDILRVEMRKWGVKVAVVEPGQYDGCTFVTRRPEWAQNFDMVWDSMSEELRQTYGKDYVFHIQKCVQEATVPGGSDPTPVLEAVTHALFAEKPRVRYLVDGHGAYFFDLHCIGARLRRWMPTWFIDWFLDKYFIGDHPLPKQLQRH